MGGFGPPRRRTVETRPKYIEEDAKQDLETRIGYEMLKLSSEIAEAEGVEAAQRWSMAIRDWAHVLIQHQHHRDQAA